MANILAASNTAVPELPNIFTIFHQAIYDNPYLHFLLYWEDIFFSLFVAATISLIFYIGSRRRELIPTGLQNFLEYVVENLRRLILDVLGPDGEKHLPFLGTIFVYILSMNWIGLVPLFKPPSSSLNITIGMAICVFVRVQYLNFKNMGVGGYLYHLSGSPKTWMEWLLVPLLFPIELLTQISRPITLALRLFGNIMGEHVLISAIAIFSIALFTIGTLPLSIPLQTPFMLFAILTGLMQALVFTLLSTVYILLSTPHHDENHSH